MSSKTMICAGLVLAFAAGTCATDAQAWGRKKQTAEAEQSRTTDDGGRVVKGKNDIEGEIIGDAAPGSAFGKLEIGMSRNQVRDLIGEGKECGEYITGKMFIPFHFGGDNMREECAYASQGRLIFTQAANGSAYLLKIVNDTSEDGYR